MSQLRRCIREVGPTIVHTHAHVGAAWGRTAAVLERVPIIIHTEHISKETLPIAQRLAHKFLNPKTSVTIAFSDRTAAIARKREKIRELRIIPNGIPLQPVPTSLQRHMARDVLNLGDAVVIGVIGNLYPHKKPELALESFGLIPAGARQNVCLAFFGEGPLRESLTARARTLGVGNATRFFGFRRDLQSLLPGLDLVLSTSSREMMPMSLLEAMNAALPIISVPHAGALDLVVSGETGIVVQSWSARDLANALQFATGKPDWRCEAGVAAYARLKKYFDIEMVADEYAALYNGLVHRRRNA
jgi:glycosyltransferase involved in cell wall biosynthesis